MELSVTHVTPTDPVAACVPTIDPVHVVPFTRRQPEKRRTKKDWTRIGAIGTWVSVVVTIILQTPPGEQQKLAELTYRSSPSVLLSPPQKPTSNGQVKPFSSNKIRQQQSTTGVGLKSNTLGATADANRRLTPTLRSGNGEGSSGALGGPLLVSSVGPSPNLVDSDAGVGHNAGSGCCSSSKSAFGLNNSVSVREQIKSLESLVPERLTGSNRL